MTRGELFAPTMRAVSRPRANTPLPRASLGQRFIVKTATKSYRENKERSLT